MARQEALEVLTIGKETGLPGRGHLRKVRSGDLTGARFAAKPAQVRVFFGRLNCIQSGPERTFFHRLRGLPRSKFVLLGEDLPPQAWSEWLSRLRVSSPHRMHLVTSSRAWGEIALRFSAARDARDPFRRIMDAWWEQDDFVVMSPRLERRRVPLATLAPLQALSPKERGDFQIDSHGEYVYWPAGDIHLGWEQFEQALGGEAMLRARQSSKEFNQKYGRAIRRLREEKGLRQSQIPGLDRRQVIRVEQGQCRATLASLRKFAEAFAVPVNDLLAELAKRASG